MNDILIVGGGLSGLGAATWCARQGARVTLLERASALGGRARTDVRAGHALNLGGHALYVRGAAVRALRDLGVTYAGASPRTQGFLAMAAGELHRLPADLFSMLATDLFGFTAKIETARALAKIARADVGALRDVTWRTWTSQVTARPEVRDTLDAIARLTTYANAPERASAGATIAQLRLGIGGGVLYLDGGWQTLVDGLEKAALTAGVTITRGAQVVSLARHGGVLRLALTDGRRMESPAVILATGPHTAGAILGDESIGRALTPARAACLDVGLTTLPDPKRLFALGIDEPTYFSVHSTSAKLTESGATLHAMKYLDPDAPADPEAARRELESLVDRVQPGWRDVVATQRFSPALVATNAIVTAAHPRPPVATGFDGVFLAGDWVGDDGMLADAALASARVAANRALEVVGRAAKRGQRSDGATMAAT